MLKVKLRQARKDKHFSRQDMAKHLNITPPQYLRKENGEIEMGDEEWERMAKLLGVEVEDIKEAHKESSAFQNFENIAGSYVGSNNVYCNVPEYLLANQQEYINILKREIADLKIKISLLEN